MRNTDDERRVESGVGHGYNIDDLSDMLEEFSDSFRGTSYSCWRPEEANRGFQQFNGGSA